MLGHLPSMSALGTRPICAAAAMVNFLLERAEMLVVGIKLEGRADLIAGGGQVAALHVLPGQDFPRLIQAGDDLLLLRLHFGIVNCNSRKEFHRGSW